MKRIVICADGTWNRPEKDLKKDFSKLAQSLWKDPIELLYLIVKNITTKKRIKSKRSNLELEIESFSDLEIKDLMKDKKIQKNMKKLESLLVNV